MTRGNQREKAREANLKKQAASVRTPDPFVPPFAAVLRPFEVGDAGR
jgi:hypothetical protein